MSYLNLIATASFGLEAVVARELKKLGYEQVTLETGRVHFVGGEDAICRSNLWLRSADRVLLKMGSFRAETFDELFENTRALPWAEWIPEDAAFPVAGKSVDSKLFSVPDCQAIVKKAVVESMKRKYRRQWFEETGSKYAVEVALLKDVVTLTIDTSGAGLHKRGYRQLTAAAPLRETLAAAMVLLTHWNPDRPLIDPFCGSGTIPIEAALIGLNMAPGLEREFDSEKWVRIPKQLWKRSRQEARDAARLDRALQIVGTDIDPDVLSLARHHGRRAGLEGRIHWQQAPVAEMQTKKKYGLIVCNPPYGERLGEKHEAERIYKDMRYAFRPLDTWSFFVLTSHTGFERIFGRRADRRRKVYNGRIECQYYQFLGPRPPRESGEPAGAAGAGRPRPETEEV